MPKYRSYGLVIPRDKREAYNNKILHYLTTDPGQLSQEEIFNAYTGAGGLHGLDYDDYANYANFAHDKRKREHGQFFTSNDVAADLVASLAVTPLETVADITCGSGVFFNHIENESRLYGNELDEKPFTVAKHLYPNANLTKGDMVLYEPGIYFDVIVGNPPFNLQTHFGKGREMLFMTSQEAYFRVCAKLLKPGGLLAAVVPESFAADEFQNKSHIEFFNENFRFLTQKKLPETAFKAYGLKFKTKVLYLQRTADALPEKPYELTFFEGTFSELLEAVVKPARDEAAKLRPQLYRELRMMEKRDLVKHQRVTKLLFDIARGKKTKDKAANAQSLFDKFLHQTKPDHRSTAEWEKTRLTWEKVIESLEDVLAKQHVVERNEVRLVKNNHTFYYKGYDGEKRKLAATMPRDSVHELARQSEIPRHLYEFRRMLRRRQRHYARHEDDLMSLTPDVNLLEDLKRHSFYKNGDSGDSLGPLFTGLSRFQLTDLQASDLARINGRDYPYLAWEPGTGKTAVSYLWAKRKKTRYLFIVSTDLSIRGTWQTFLPLQGETYQLLDAFKDVANLKPGIILLTFDRMRVLYPYLKRFLRGLGKHSTIIFDEGDELINVGTERTQTALALFRRFRYKLVATGTPTRNSIQELYPQLELLFNNSTLMCNDAEFLYHVDEKSGETERIVNDERGVPFRARSGYKDFCETFSPKKVTVFGINKDTQDVYNMKYLTPLLSRFRITRTFDEVVGDGKYVYHQHALPMSSGEAALQEKLIKEFYSFKNYFQDTGNSRKEAGLRALRQLMLLKNMTSFGHLYPDATYSTSTKLEHAVKLVERTPDLVAIGLTRKIVDGANYLVHWREQLEHLGRPFFLVDGDMSALERKRLTDEFQKSGNGILIATQTALPASLNIPACNTVIVPEWPWNWPRIRQFIGRFIRFDSTDQTNVHFLLLDRSIDINLWNLIVNKEHLNNIVKHGREANNETLCEMFGLDSEILNMVMAKELDHEGKVSINWTQQTM